MSTAANRATTATGPAPEASAADPRATIGGRYEIDLSAPLAGGGICLVYAGRDLKARRPVAVKTLRLEYRDDPDTRARFRREARLLAFLGHPNVVRVYDFVEDRGATWVVLERIDGPNLKDHLAGRGPLPPAEVAPLLDQAAAALAHLHAKGLVHLDVKPQNLLLTDDGRIKLIDLGLAQAAGNPPQAPNGRAFGTAAYLAPEQACGDPVGPAADVYALGCVVYELLTGHPPFAAPPAGTAARPDPTPAPPKHELIRARLERLPTPPTRLRPDLRLPAWVDDVVLWALARDPVDRYGGAELFARLFRAGVDGDEPGEGATLVGPPPAPIELPRPPAATEPPRNVYAPLPEQPALVRLYEAGGRAARRAASLRRRLWQAVAALLLANLLLAGALVLARGELPGLYAPAAELRPGATARAIADDLLVRAGPSFAAPAIGQLAAGTRVELTGEPIAADDESWWPVAASVDGVPLEGYTAGGWLEPVRPPAPLERLRAALPGLD